MKAFSQSTKRLPASDVVSLLREVYPQGVRSRSEAEALIAFDREFADPAPEWRNFIATAIADHLLQRSAPAKVITPEKAAWLLRAVAPHGAISTPGGAEIVIRTAAGAEEIPASFSAFAIRQFSLSNLLERKPRAVSASDVAAISRILVAGAGVSGTAVSLAEAEALFDLHDAAAGTKYHASLDDLFFRAIVNYALNASGEETISRDDAMAREPRRGSGALVNAEINAWIASRIMRDGRPTVAERALLAFMDKHAEPNPADPRYLNRAA